MNATRLIAVDQNPDIVRTIPFDKRLLNFVTSTRGGILRPIEKETGACIQIIAGGPDNDMRYELRVSGSETAVTQVRDEFFRIIDENRKYWYCCNCHHGPYDYYNRQRCLGCKHDRCLFCQLLTIGDEHVAVEWWVFYIRIRDFIREEYVKNKKSLEEVRRVILDKFARGVDLPMSVLERQIGDWGFSAERRQNELRESGLDQVIAPPSPHIENLAPPKNRPTGQPPKIFITRAISQDVTPTDQTRKIFIARTISQDLTGSGASNDKHLLCALRDRPSGLKFSSKRLFREEVGSGVGKRRRM